MKNKKKYLGDPHKAKQKWLREKRLRAAEKKLSAGGDLALNAEKFWDSEYGGASKNFSLSIEASEDLQKFVKWLERQYKGQQVFSQKSFVVDAGCGNGRNLLWLAKNYKVSGVGYDLSSVGIKTAKKKAEEEGFRGLSFLVQNLNQKIPCEDGRADLVIDAVATHVLRKEEREFFKQEVLRALSVGSYYFLKSLLLDGDRHAEKMIDMYGKAAGEANSYIHPTMGIFEHVPTETELVNFYKEDFEIEKIIRSQLHELGWSANKRRYIVLYLRKK